MTRARGLVPVAVVALAGCSSRPLLIRVPLASAGEDVVVPTGTTVTLDAIDSTAYGARFGYRWRVGSAPDGSTAQLATPAERRTSFKPDRDGDYVVELVVTVDGGVESAADELLVHAYNVPPVIGSGAAPRDVYRGEPLELEAFATDGNGDAPAISWSLTSRPPGSAATLAGGGARPTFVADLLGEYQLEVTVSDGRAAITQAVKVTAHVPARAIGGTVIDADFSDALDAVVMASTAPDAVTVLSPATGDTRSIALPAAPTSLGLAVDGRVVAVGHDRAVSVVSLDQGVVLRTYPVAILVHDVALAANGHLYATADGTGWSPLHDVELATGVERAEGGINVDLYDGSFVKVHPSGARLYSAESSLSSGSIYRYDLGGGAPERTRGGYGALRGSFCRDLWFSDDGARVFTGCGIALRSSAELETDLIYNGTMLANDGGVAFVDDSSVAGKVVLVPADGPWWVSIPFDFDDVAFHVHDRDFLERERTVPEGSFRSASGSWLRGATRWAFISADGRRVYALMQAVFDRQLIAAFGLATHDL